MMLVLRVLTGLLGYISLLGLSCLFFEPLRIHKTWIILWLLLLCSVLVFAFRSRAHRRYVASVICGVFRNPMFFVSDLVYLFSQFVIWLYAYGRLPRVEQFVQSKSFSLPFEGLWTVYNGGVDLKSSHSWSIINQRYAYDLVVTDERKQTYKNYGQRLEDYYAFGKPILAPADGVVVHARDGMPDHTKPGSGWIDWRVTDPRGNHLVIKHYKGEYSVLAHLKQGSVIVKPGDQVKRKKQIGLCGNSGHSYQPHLHFHVQNNLNFCFAIGLPVEFSDFTVIEAGQRVGVERGYISKGQLVEPK